MLTQNQKYIFYLIMSVILLVSIIIIIKLIETAPDTVPQTLIDNAESFLNSNNWQPKISKEDIDTFMIQNKCSLEQCLLAFANASQHFAYHVPISNYKVGAVVRGKSGVVYCGGNTEFTGVSLTNTIHGEQSATHNAFYNGETEITHLAVNEPPCGYCRQFLNELSNANKLIILIQNEGKIIAKPLESGFLPYSFGPEDLGNSSGMMDSKPFNLAFDSSETDPFKLTTLNYAKISYSPYGLLPSAIGLKFSDNTNMFGIYLENAAYNPTLHPMVAALNISLLYGKKWEDISQICLIESVMPVGSSKQKDISSLPGTRDLLLSINKDSSILQYIGVNNNM